MIGRLLAVGFALIVPTSARAQEPTVKVEPPQLQGSRPLEKQTETSVVREYLQGWKILGKALDQNRPELLDAYFVGTARDKIAETIDGQIKSGIHTQYQDRMHDLQIVFYSPEGLSIQILDTVEYEERVLDHEKVLATKVVRRKYIVVLSPSEVRWRVRIFQAGPS